MTQQSLSESKQVNSLKANLIAQLIMETENNTGKFQIEVSNQPIFIEFALNHTYLENNLVKEPTSSNYYAAAIVEFPAKNEYSSHRLILSSPLLRNSNKDIDYLIYEWLVDSLLHAISTEGRFVGTDILSKRYWKPVYNTISARLNQNSLGELYRFDHFNFLGKRFGRSGYHMTESTEKLKQNPPLNSKNVIPTYTLKRNNLELAKRTINLAHPLTINRIKPIDGWVQNKFYQDFYEVKLTDGITFIVDDAGLSKITQNN